MIFVFFKDKRKKMSNLSPPFQGGVPRSGEVVMKYKILIKKGHM